MPQTRVQAYRNAKGDVPVGEWLASLDPKPLAKCLAVIQELERLGYELRRPAADSLRDGIYELRTHYRTIRYRILYFFHGRNAVVLTHGITKGTAKVPDKEIERAIKARRDVEADPTKHIATWEGEGEEDQDEDDQDDD